MEGAFTISFTFDFSAILPSSLQSQPMANVPTGCMVGSHGIAVMASAFLQCTPGVSGTLGDSIFNVSRAAVESQASSNRYASLGWVPSEDSKYATSITLAFAFDDGVAALLAAQVGQTEWHSKWRNRSQAYVHVWNNVTQFMCPRSCNGSFHCPASPFLPYPLESGYTEGDGAQWQWFVPHDLPGLLDKCWMGDVATYSLSLHSFMLNQLNWTFVTDGVSDYLPNAWYWAGNEPDILSAWEFNTAGPKYFSLIVFCFMWLHSMLLFVLLFV